MPQHEVTKTGKFTEESEVLEPKGPKLNNQGLGYAPNTKLSAPVSPYFTTFNSTNRFPTQQLCGVCMKISKLDI